MPEYEYDLVIVLTAGCSAGRPTLTGKRRLAAAVRLCHAGRARGIAILGGFRDRGAPSEAEAYAVWASTCPAVKEGFISLVSGSAMCTARDLLEAYEGIERVLALTDKSPANARIGVPTYEQHFERIRTTLTFLRFNELGIVRVENYSEGQGYPRTTEYILSFVTSLDPTWTWLGLLLVALANHRIHLSDTYHPTALPIEPAQLV